MSSSGDKPPSGIAATDEAAALLVVPNLRTDNATTQANVAPDAARPPSNLAELNIAATDEAVALLVVPNPTADNNGTPLSTFSDPSPIVTMMLEFGFTFASGENSLPVDEQCEHCTLDSLRQVAAYL